MFPVCDLNFNDVDQWAIGISSCGRLDCGLCEDHYERADVEVMQFTGLKDKNGREIYGGDVVKGYNRVFENVSYRYEVAFLNGCYMFGNWNAHEYFNKHQEMEVIGNIYENPELLGDIE